MAADVSSLVQILNEYIEDQQQQIIGGEPKIPITRDLLGGCSKLGSKELDLDLQVPNGWEKRLDLKVRSPIRFEFLDFLLRGSLFRFILWFAEDFLSNPWNSVSFYVWFQDFLLKFFALRLKKSQFLCLILRFIFSPRNFCSKIKTLTFCAFRFSQGKYTCIAAVLQSLRPQIRTRSIRSQFLNSRTSTFLRSSQKKA